MTSDDIKTKLNELNDEVSNGANYYLYALKLENKRIKGKHILSYNFFDSQMKKNEIKKSLDLILDNTNKKFLDNSETVYEEYKATNLKTTVDYIKLSEIDFSNPDIINGTSNECNSDNYKVQYLINAMHNNIQISEKEFKNFKGIKYTTFYCSTKNHDLIIINKGNPIYKPKNILFSLDSDGKNFTYSPIEDSLFKIPFYPGILIIDDICLFIADKIETLFGFSEQTKIIKNDILNKISKSSIFDESQLFHLNKFANKGKNYNYFITFDKERLDKIHSKDKKAIKTLKSAGLRFTPKNDPVIENEEDAEKVMAFICNVLKKDAYNEDSYCISLNNKAIKNVKV